jgi:hypothetical protein
MGFGIILPFVPKSSRISSLQFFYQNLYITFASLPPTAHTHHPFLIVPDKGTNDECLMIYTLVCCDCLTLKSKYAPQRPFFSLCSSLILRGKVSHPQLAEPTMQTKKLSMVVTFEGKCHKVGMKYFDWTTLHKSSKKSVVTNILYHYAYSCR